MRLKLRFIRQEHVMLRASIAIALAASLASLPGIALAAHGIQTGDMNPVADACTDFYEFANGHWRAENPIPSYMDRWSRRWASGENNKTNLQNILIEVSTRQDWPEGSTEQLIGDHFAACTNESQIDKLGAKPAQPMLTRIDALKNMDAVQAMIGEFARLGISAPIFIEASQDLHEPTIVIAHLGAGGIGLPDRDYYINTEPRFVEARVKYLAHVAKMLELTGTKPIAARKAADTVFAFEHQLAKASLDNVELRNPKLQDHKTKFADLGKLTPHFDWARYFDALNLPHGDVNVTQPKFLEEFDKRLHETSLAEWKTYLRWQFVNAKADVLAKAVVEENFAFNGKFLSGAAELKPRATRCAENVDALLGEALGRKYVEKHFPPEAKARMQELVRNLLLALQDTINGLDWISQAAGGRITACRGRSHRRFLQYDRAGRAVSAGAGQLCRRSAPWSRCRPNSPPTPNTRRRSTLQRAAGPELRADGKQPAPRLRRVPERRAAAQRRQARRAPVRSPQVRIQQHRHTERKK